MAPDPVCNDLVANVAALAVRGRQRPSWLLQRPILFYAYLDVNCAPLRRRVDGRATRGQAAMWTAVIRAALGQREVAVALRSRAIAEEVPPFLLHKQPGLDPLRGYGPYQARLRPRPAVAN